MTRNRIRTVATLLVVLPTVLGVLAPGDSARADESADARALRLTASPDSRSVPWRDAVTIRGVLTDELGSALSGVKVRLEAFVLDEFADYYWTDVDSGVTDESGAYAIRYTLESTIRDVRYRVTARVENGPGRDDDELAQTWPGYINSRAVIGNVSVARHSGARFTVQGGISPRASSGSAHPSSIELWAGRRGQPRTKRADYLVRGQQGVFGRRFKLAPGTWNIQVRYIWDDGEFDAATYSTAIVLR